MYNITVRFLLVAHVTRSSYDIALRFDIFVSRSSYDITVRFLLVSHVTKSSYDITVRVFIGSSCN